MDLFGNLEATTPAPRIPAIVAITRPPSPEMRAPDASIATITWPRLVASFACHCGAHDEVMEPAPAHVDCWKCKGTLAMYRWHPRQDPPCGNARQLTDAERSRM